MYDLDINYSPIAVKKLNDIGDNGEMYGNHYVLVHDGTLYDFGKGTNSINGIYLMTQDNDMKDKYTIKSENNVLGKDNQAQKDKWAQDKAALGVRIDASKNRRDKAEAKLAGMGKEDDYNKDVNEKQTAFDELDAAMKAIFDGDKIVDKNINDNLKALQDFFNNAAAPDTLP